MNIVEIGNAVIVLTRNAIMETGEFEEYHAVAGNVTNFNQNAIEISDRIFIPMSNIAAIHPDNEYSRSEIDNIWILGGST